MIQVTLPVIFMSLQKSLSQGCTNTQDCLSKSDPLELHRSSCMELTTPVQFSSGVLINSRHSNLCYTNVDTSITGSSGTKCVTGVP